MEFNLVHECPMCDNAYMIRINQEDYDRYQDGGVLIQDIFPDLNPMEREFIKTGYCPKCQSMLFGSNYTSDKIKKLGA